MKVVFLMLTSLTCMIHARAQTTSTSTSHSQSGIKDALYMAEEMPEFPGGTAEQMNYISKNIHYPPISRDPGYEGTSYIRFIVDTAGYIKEASVLKGLPNCPPCNQEALRVINAMPR